MKNILNLFKSEAGNYDARKIVITIGVIAFLAFMAFGLSGCEKAYFQKSISGKQSQEQVFDLLLKKHVKGEAIMDMDEQKCTRRIENLDSLIQTGYWIWYEVDLATITNVYEEGDLPRVVADTAIMRCGVMGYGSAKMRLEGQPVSENRRMGVTHYPSGTVPGSEIIEIFNTQLQRSWILRKDIMTEGMGLAYCTAFDGFANEGMQTGAIDAFFRDPNGDFYIADEANSLGATITLTKVDSTFTNNFSPYRFIWRNFQTDAQGIAADVHQLCSVVIWRCDISIETIGFECLPNTYFGNMRSQYLSNNTCGGSDNYILQSGEVQGQFVNN